MSEVRMESKELSEEQRRKELLSDYVKGATLDPIANVRALLFCETLNENEKWDGLCRILQEMKPGEIRSEVAEKVSDVADLTFEKDREREVSELAQQCRRIALYSEEVFRRYEFAQLESCVVPKAIAKKVIEGLKKLSEAEKVICGLSRGLIFNGFSDGGVYGVRFFPEGRKLLTDSPYLKNIRHLSLDQARFDTEGAKGLAESKFLKNLKHLSLGINGLRNEGIEALANSPNLEGLEHLSIPFNIFDSEGAYALAKSPYLCNLQFLNIRSNAIGSEGASYLMDSPILKNLKYLNVGDCRLGNGGVRQLVCSVFLENLEELHINSNGFNNNGARALSDTLFLTNLKSLNVSCNSINVVGLRELLYSPNLVNLKRLNLAYCRIGEDGIRELLESKLEWVSLEGVNLGDLGGRDDVKNLFAEKQIEVVF